MPIMTDSAVNYLLLENDLRRGIEQNEILLHYQPQINLNTGKIIGLEALVRWNSKERGMVSPVNFIPLAEETGVIEPLGEGVLRLSLLHIRRGRRDTHWSSCRQPSKHK